MTLLIKDFSTGYDNKIIIKNINFELKDSEWVGIIGANGSGKSTLLKGILKFNPIIQGDIFLNSRNTKSFSRKNLSQKIAYLPQKINNNLNITVKELVTLGRSPYKSFWEFNMNEKDMKIINEAIEILDLENLKNNYINELSGGQCQRAFLAMTLSQNPEILLLDEPTTFLDINYQLKFLELINKLIKIKKLSVITVLHDINLACRFCDRLAIFKEGNLIDIDKPKKVLSKDNLYKAFEIDSYIVETPLGFQIFPVSKK
tara:strand:- start:18780 stop:19556 length:777 start_codon:yes stop_codon:yes gene_type:complete